MNLNYENIIKAKSNLNYPSQLFINGKYQKSFSGKSFDNGRSSSEKKRKKVMKLMKAKKWKLPSLISLSALCPGNLFESQMC